MVRIESRSLETRSNGTQIYLIKADRATFRNIGTVLYEKSLTLFTKVRFVVKVAEQIGAGLQVDKAAGSP